MSAAIGAAFLLYFGFNQIILVDFATLDGKVWWVFNYTLQIGGICMAVVSLLLFIGLRLALLADGVVSVLVGALLVLTGIGIFFGGDTLQALINVACGYMFYSSGVQNGRDYFRLTKRATRPIADRDYPTPAMTEAEPQTVSPGPAVEERIAPARAIETFAPEPPAPVPEPVVDANTNLDQNHQPDIDPAPAPPGGYLASFAKKDPPQDS